MFQGSVVSLHIAPARSAPMQTVGEVRAVPGRGLVGDRFLLPPGAAERKPDGLSDVTLIEVEAVEALRTVLGDPDDQARPIELAPVEARRNIVTAGVPLNHLLGREFRVGDVLMRGWQLCEPCTHLEALTGRRLIHGLLHRGGLRAQILSEGVIRVGEAIVPT